ncbi:MAG: branched-chain amino acid ABC transporter permease [Actinobacteria bacterium]|nr:branched-chain amino acid ABC transporter permease [Actinomycetota bacterium]NBP91771.1 branched-chain amino acid ABC transporter permease [Actinomycetota bacterium]
MTQAAAVEKVAVRQYKGTPGQIRRRRIELTAGLVLSALALVWIVANIINSPTQFAQVFILGFRNGLLYALIALGYTLVYGIIELINFAHGDLFMLGTLFSSYFITVWFGQEASNLAGWLTFFGALIAAMAFCGGLNILIERFAYRRLRRAPKIAPLITAVGVSFILQFIGIKWNGSTPRNWPKVLPQSEFTVLGVHIAWNTVILLLVAAPLLLLLSWVVTKTRQGKAMRATAQDQDAARLMGIDVNRTISFTFALGGALAGAAGLLYQQTTGTTNYNLGFQLGLIAFTSAVLGGIGNLNGAVLGAVLIGIIQGLNDGLPIGLGQKWSQTVVFTILILIMVFKPAGLLGKSTTEKV